MKKFLIVFIIFSVFLISCEEEEVAPVEDSVLKMANIEGAVKLFDEYGTADTQDRMLVYLDGGTGYFWGETEKDGAFLIFNALYHVNYTIVYEKDGYGTYKKYGYNHEYTGNVGVISETPFLGKISSTTVSQLMVEAKEENVEFEVTLGSKETAGEKKIRFLFHTVPVISHDIFSKYTSKFTMTNSHHTLILSKEYLQEIGLESGVKYYVQAYGASYYSNAYYDDINSKFVLPNLGYDENSAVPTDSFIMP